MGQVSVPGKPGITVLPIDRETGPGAGAGNSGNYSIFLGESAGQNNTQANMIGIGFGVMKSGVTDPNIAGSIGIGANALASSTIGTIVGANTVIGTNAGTLADAMAASVLIGDNVLSAQTGNGAQPIRGNVVIGSNAAANIDHPSFFNYNVVIGYNAVNTVFTGKPQGIQNSVVIGANALIGLNNQNNDMNSLVIIGANAAPALTIASNNLTMIGPGGVGTGMNYGSNNVMIGGSTTNSASVYYSVSVGDQAHAGVNQNVILGATAGASAGANNIGQGAVLIGFGAGSNGAVNAFDFIAEWWDVGHKTLFYGNFNSGNLIVGNVAVADRDLAGIGATNAMKLGNGARGAGNPSNGGFFYVNAGALHWVGSAGTDTTIAVA